jgi:hypothetical protein
MAVGDYEQLENERRRAFKLRRSAYNPQDREAYERRYAELNERRALYLRELLASLPFRWHIAHAYTPRETATYGGADHIVVDETVHFGRFTREPGDALSRAKKKFWGLQRVEEGRLPSAQADIRIAEKLVEALPPEAKTSTQLADEIAKALRRL